MALVGRVRESFGMLKGGPYQVYENLFKIVYHAAKQVDFPEVEENPLLYDIVQDCKAFIITLNKVVKEVGIDSINLLYEAISRLEEIAPSHVVLCDALSLPEYLYIAHVFRQWVEDDLALCALNLSGKTSTFKFLAQHRLNLQTSDDEEVVMRDVGEGLRRIYSAIDFRLFSGIDRLVHSMEASDIREMTNAIFHSFLEPKLLPHLKRLLDAKRTTLVIADHGYDLHYHGDKWHLIHGYGISDFCLSPLIPIIVIG